MTEIHPSDLLPWYVNGTLDKMERYQIEQHLEHCQQCQNEITYLKHLRSHIKSIENQHQSPAELGLARLKQKIRNEPMSDKPRRWLMPALAAAAIVIIAQAGLLLHTPSEQNMQLMSGTAEGDIQVRFAPDTSAKEIETLLQSIQGSIVNGPSAMGVYHIHITTPATDKQAITAAVHQLRTHNDVILFAAEEPR